ncbi:MAG: hypothetical protein HKP38_02540 [Croceitalea sp.]|nr:hypothetical protein [Croceitalea sp.]MBT8237581.1 hypothetical protein [Croceitalea sp.]NNL08078.1 hypothetical protein [Croceitalea sp.]NNM17390.1 hypothetical protein [Croceitalea sp.]
MKRFKTLPYITSLALLFLFSCSSDDGGSGSNNSGLELVGNWVLSAVNVSSAIDANNDGESSFNLLDETTCLRESITLKQDFTWSSSAVNADLISAITGNLYNVSCSSNLNTIGTWGFTGSNLVMAGAGTRTLFYDGTKLIETLGNDLPGIQSLVFERQ